MEVSSGGNKAPALVNRTVAKVVVERRETKKKRVWCRNREEEDRSRNSYSPLIEEQSIDKLKVKCIVSLKPLLIENLSITL